MSFKFKYFIPLLLISTSVADVRQIDGVNKNFKPGADVLIGEHLDLLIDKKVGLVVNHTSILSNGTHILDTLLSLGEKVSAIFTPEHGFYGDIQRGKFIQDSKIGKIPVHSLHGKFKKPTDDMLRSLDIIIYDIQDLSVRFYTYVSTLYYVLESAVEHNIPMIVLDRPIPNGGLEVAGPVLKSDFKSFLGLTEIPVLYGMTAGELARLYLSEFISDSSYNLEVIELQNWNRGTVWSEIGIEWIPPSPNIPDPQTAVVYPGTCFLEGTNISEGRGTEKPFLQIGAPFVSSAELLNEMSAFIDKTFELDPVSFKPISVEGEEENPRYKNEICNGILVTIKNEKKFDAVTFGVNLIFTLHRLYPDQLKFNDKHFDFLAGSDQLRKLILTNHTPDFIFKSWEEDLNSFKSIREKYLLY